jgi:hypothetical protein
MPVPKSIPLSSISPNDKNPRLIGDKEFESLKASIKRDPEILFVNPIVLHSKNNYTILAGEKRFYALKALDYKEIPLNWLLFGDALTETQRQKFILLDNLHSGIWDITKLKDDWAVQIKEWDIEIPEFELTEQPNELLDATGDIPEEPKSIPSATHNDYSVFELVMLHENKLKLLQLLNTIKTKHQFEKLEAALMYLVELNPINA